MTAAKRNKNSQATTRAQQAHDALDKRAHDIATRLLADIVEARRVNDWSQNQLAIKLGVSVEAIARVEDGTGAFEVLVDMMSALNIQLAQIGRGSTLGDQLAMCRSMRKLSVAQVAAKTGLTETVIEDLEHSCGTLADLFRLLALIAPQVRRRAAERSYWGIGDKLDRDSRFSPPHFMAAVYDAFGAVDIDPCAHPSSPVIAARRLMPALGGDGLTEDWSGQLAYVNPPYSNQLTWLKRGFEQWWEGNVGMVVFLLPVRTDNRFFHETLHWHADLFLLQGRLRFADVCGAVRNVRRSACGWSCSARRASRKRGLPNLSAASGLGRATDDEKHMTRPRSRRRETAWPRSVFVGDWAIG